MNAALAAPGRPRAAAAEAGVAERYAATYARLVGALTVATGSRADAEEVVQEAFLSMWRSGARYDRQRGSVRTWILGIVHHRAIDALRRATVHDKRRTSDEWIAERLEASERTDVEVARLDEARRVKGALGTLPEEQSRVIQLAYYGGFSHSEIAEMLELPLGTIKGRMRLGLDKLRNELGEAVVA